MIESTAKITLNGTSNKLYQNDRDERYIELRIADAVSGQMICTAQFSGDEIIAMLAGHYLGHHPITWHAPDLIGWVPERFHEDITTPERDDNDHSGARAAVLKRVTELEKVNPGCQVSASEVDAWNHHRRQAVNIYRVAFTILRPPTEKED